MTKPTNIIFTPDLSTPLKLPYFTVSVSAGFPSPADDHLDKKLDLNELFVAHPAATFYVRVSGDSMIDAGIHDGDMLIVDRSLDAKDGSIIVAIVNGDFTVKRLRTKSGSITLIAENKEYSSIEIIDGMEFEVWGVVSSVIHNLI